MDILVVISWGFDEDQKEVDDYVFYLLIDCSLLQFFLHFYLLTRVYSQEKAMHFHNPINFNF